MQPVGPDSRPSREVDDARVGNAAAGDAESGDAESGDAESGDAESGDAKIDALEAGARLAAQERRLRLLLAHLAGRAVRARVGLDDLLQEVFLRALASTRGLPPVEPGEVALWRLLALLARQVVIDIARALRARKRAARESPLQRSDWSRTGSGHLPRAAGPGPGTAASTAETGRLLAQAFLALTPEHRRVLGLRQFDGLSARATAQRMGRSESAVHSLYRRALTAWEAALEGSGISCDESSALVRPDRT